MRIVTLVPAVAAIALGSCAQPPAPPGAALAQTLAGRVPGKPQTCISPFGQQGPYIIDRQSIGYGYGKTVYVNRLRAPCPGMDQMNILITETHGGMYCSGDHVRAAEPGAIIPGPVCLLGDWTPFTSQ